MKPVRIVTGRVAALDRTNVDTDQIIPKQFLKRIERTGFGEFLFWDWAKQPDFPLNRPEFQGAPILAAGRNFGSGSSREHAPWALQDHGFEAIIAPSFSDIFKANCAMIGLLAVELDEADVRELLDRAPDEATVDLERRVVDAAVGPGGRLPDRRRHPRAAAQRLGRDRDDRAPAGRDRALRAGARAHRAERAGPLSAASGVRAPVRTVGSPRR